MGRSVDYLNRASRVAYIHCDTTFTDEDGNTQNDEFWFDDLLSNITCELEAKYPSLNRCKRWDGRETKIFLHSNLVEIGISEYCGLVSVSIRPTEHWEGQWTTGLAERWIDQNWENMEKKLSEFSTVIRKIATASNGEAFFELKTFA